MEIEGLVLRTTPFQESDYIVTLFTPQALFKLFVKGRRRLTPHLHALISPFTIAIFSYRATKSELNRFIEGKIVDQNLLLRNRLASFEAAQKILQTLYTTQWQNKPAPALYALAKALIAKIPQLDHPETLVPIFFLKLLKHEGILDFDAFSQEERPQVEALASIRSFAHLQEILPNARLKKKIEEHFHSAILM